LGEENSLQNPLVYCKQKSPAPYGAGLSAYIIASTYFFSSAGGVTGATGAGAGATGRGGGGGGGVTVFSAAGFFSASVFSTFTQP
jgi:hypothetical protein